MNSLNRALYLLGAALTLTSAHAVPVLQLYIEGAVYDQTTATWNAEISANGTLTLWAIGNVAGEGGKGGTISDVKLAAAYSSNLTPTITLTGTKADASLGFTDVNVPNSPASRTVTDGSIPKLTDGSNLSSHGQYGAGTWWQEFRLGDFTERGDSGGDFMSSLPTPLGLGYQINAYQVSISGADTIHFDLYDSVEARNKARSVFAPFSHDAAGTQVPDGGSTVFLIGMALMAFAGMQRRLRRS